MSNSNTGAAGGGAIYALGIFGAWVWFWQQAGGFWEYVLAIFQGLLGPPGWFTRSSRRWPADGLRELLREPRRGGTFGPSGGRAVSLRS